MDLEASEFTFVSKTNYLHISGVIPAPKIEASVVGRSPSRCFKCFDIEHLAKECSLFRWRIPEEQSLLALFLTKSIHYFVLE